ncbi:MAG: hypothetical protein M1827_003041 [Pycnora praestabilis]|nr:MAG: hypothetical protein M1827_003041 [Pycnora praestabilis]
MEPATEITSGAQNIPAQNATTTPVSQRARGGRGARFRGEKRGGYSNESNPYDAESHRDGRRSGRNGRSEHLDSDEPRGGRRGARGGRGSRAGGDLQDGRFSNSNAKPSPPVPPPPSLGSQGSFGNRLAGDASQNEGEGGVRGRSDRAKGAVDEIEAESSAEYVIFTDDASKRYEDFIEIDFARKDDNLGVKYENMEIFEDTVLLLRYNCPESSCDVACMGWPDLHRHVKSVHHEVMCDLCTRNKKVFTHEHELFTVPELRRHEKFGDDNPGAIDQSGFKGHPECGFCRQRFYGDDELYVHCRDKHERCHICDRRNQGRQQQYYVDYNSLEVHFRKDHFLCLEQDCLDKKFVVFDSEMDLKAHQLQEHPNGMSKDARRDARIVNLSGFDYRSPHQPDNRGSRREREGRGRGRGRDPNTEALPHSTAQPLRRDELAYQRQMAVQSAQSVSTRTFGGQLTSNDAYVARAPATTNDPVIVTGPREGPSGGMYPSLDSLNLGPSSSSSPVSPSSPLPAHALTPQEQARRLRHNAVVERASNMLKNDQTKITEFRAKISSFRTSATSATGLIDSFFALFDTSAAELGKLIKELADIFEIDTKRDSLLKAWNDWRAINEDYPTLPGPSGVLPSSQSAASSSGGRRVLKLKSSTAQSSRSAVSRHGSWGNAANSNPFPPMQAGVAASANRTGAGRVSATPWVTPSASSRPSPASSRPSSKPPTGRVTNSVASDAFPALPTATKPTSTIFGYGNGAVRRDNGNKSGVNAWGNGASSSTEPSAAPSENEADGEMVGGGKKKGNKNKKQTLFHFG